MCRTGKDRSMLVGPYQIAPFSDLFFTSFFEFVLYELNHALLPLDGVDYFLQRLFEERFEKHPLIAKMWRSSEYKICCLIISTKS